MASQIIAETAAEPKAAPIYHPILFSAPMVVANREGRKTMTRRVVTLREFQASETPGYDWTFRGTRNGGARGSGVGCWQDYRNADFLAKFCPYGVPGDRLWVRERMRVIEVRSSWTISIRVRYEADGAESGWLPYPERLKGEPVVGKCLSYGGYREASRDTLEVTAVRVERLQSITPNDAFAEGVCEYLSHLSRTTTLETVREFYRKASALQIPYACSYFAVLWDSINAGRGWGWGVNPYVWVVSYRRLEALTPTPGDASAAGGGA